MVRFKGDLCLVCCLAILTALELGGVNGGTDSDNKPSRSRYTRSYSVGSRDRVSKNDIALKDGQEAVFLTPNSSLVIAQMGGTAKLPCVVRKVNNGVVSWIRKFDSPPTILTIGLGAYIADERFMVEHARHLQNWGLVIKHVRHTDAGSYECQVSTHPATSIFIELRVTEAIAEITGAPELHVRAGSRLKIVCRLRYSTEQPDYVFWYHYDRMINHDPGVFVSEDRTSSVLQLEDVDPNNSGNYTCYPSNATPAYVNVHVLNSTDEENPAAMMHANCSDGSTALVVSIIFAVFVNVFMIWDR